jgi:hypothetical protein
MATKKFPLGKCRELAAHVASMHETLQSLLAECDAPNPAQDDSDSDAPYAQGQDRKTVSMDEAFNRMRR